MLECACRAMALLGIASMVHQEAGTARIHIKFISLLVNVDDIKNYAWGVASWANLHCSLKAVKTISNKTNIFGCVLGLMVFTLAHVPKLLPHCFQNLAHVNPVFPLMYIYMNEIGQKRFYNTKHRPSVNLILNLFLELALEELVSQPYSAILPEPYASQRALGRLVTTGISEPYATNHLPHEAYRQLFDTEPHVDEDWLSKLPNIPIGRLQGCNASDLASWIASWDLRWEQLICAPEALQSSTSRSEASPPSVSHSTLQIPLPSPAIYSNIPGSGGAFHSPSAYACDMDFVMMESFAGFAEEHPLHPLRTNEEEPLNTGFVHPSGPEEERLENSGNEEARGEEENDDDEEVGEDDVADTNVIPQSSLDTPVALCRPERTFGRFGSRIVLSRKLRTNTNFKDFFVSPRHMVAKRMREEKQIRQRMEEEVNVA